jgi:hypothetical protein
MDDEPAGLDAALTDLRVADAKHRLAYILTRAALIDCERGRYGAANARATEALGYATLLERNTEMLLATAVLSHDCRVKGDSAGAACLEREVVRLRAAGAAVWTRDVAERWTSENTDADTDTDTDTDERALRTEAP